MQASKRILLALALACACAAPQAAGAASTGAAPTGAAPTGAAELETLLRLSEQAQVRVQPDTLAASLRIEADADTAAAAQARVNAQTAKAIAAAKATPGVVANTGFYNVWRAAQPAPPHWHAAQTVDLHGGDGPAMLALVGRLQGEGMAVQQLGWRLSPEATRKAQDEATRMALTALRARAESAAAILGLRFVAFREVRLDGNPPTPRPMPQLAMAARAAMPAPVAENEPLTIEASVGADAVLAPRQP